MADNLYLNDLVVKHLTMAMEFAGNNASNYIDGIAQASFDTRVSAIYGRRKCVSPLEAVFLLWWEAADLVRHFGASFWVPLHLFDEHTVEIPNSQRTYRLDFIVRESPFDGRFQIEKDAARLSLPLPKIGIELDGHEFHERTKEQVTYRNERDRELQRAGWKVFHFSGAELVAKPRQCVEEVWSFAHDAYTDLYSECGKRSATNG